MVIVETNGRIPPEHLENFEASYAYLKQKPIPTGILRSTLYSSNRKHRAYHIVTVWKSREAYQRYISKIKTLEAVRIFRSVGVEPAIKLFDVVDNIP